MVFPPHDPNQTNQRHSVGVREWAYKNNRWEIATADTGIGGNHYYKDSAPNGRVLGDIWTDSKTLITYVFNGSEWTEIGRGTVS